MRSYAALTVRVVATLALVMSASCGGNVPDSSLLLERADVSAEAASTRGDAGVAALSDTGQTRDEDSAQPASGDNDCGLEVTSCESLGRLPTGPQLPAECTHESYEDAVARYVDGGHVPISNVRCDGTWLALDIDLGADACPPEDHSCYGQRVHRAFWKNAGTRWQLLGYQGTGDCREAWSIDADFPEEVCRP